jgi:transposase-like protein
MRKKRKILSPKEKEKICQLYTKGEKVSIIASEFNSDPSWIVKIVKSKGFHKPKKERGEQIFFKFTKEQERQIIDLNLARKNAKEIARIMNTSYDQVKLAIVKLGLKPLSISEAKRVYTVDEYWLDSIDSPEKALFLGLFFADGCNQSANNSCDISLHKKDLNYLKRFADLITDKPLSICKTKNQIALKICSKHFSEKLNYYGATPKKSLTLEWPQNLDPKYWRFFIKGFFEGDGGFSINFQSKSKIYYNASFTSTLLFLQKLNAIIFNELGISGKIYQKTKRGTYGLYFQKQKELKILVKWLYQDYEHLAMERKLDIAKQILKI